MRYKLAIFDLDGTILDTLEDLADSMNHALEVSGYPKRTLQEIRSFVGDGMLLLVKRALPAGVSEAMAEKVLLDLKAYYKIHCADKTKPYDGVLALLQELKAAGYQMAVVSNKADYAVQILCEQYFGGMFDLAVGEREGVNKKPAPDAVNMVLNELQIKRENAVYIGDSEVDIMTAENAKVDSVLVTWGFREAEFLKHRGAGKLVASASELGNYLLSKIADN